MMLLLKVMRWLTLLRHSSGVLPTKRLPDADRFSSRRPLERAMVDDHVGGRADRAHRVGFPAESRLVRIADAHADVPDHDVVGANVDAAANQA